MRLSASQGAPAGLILAGLVVIATVTGLAAGPLLPLAAPANRANLVTQTAAPEPIFELLPNWELGQRADRPLPNWEVGAVASQLLPNYEPGSARVVPQNLQPAEAYRYRELAALQAVPTAPAAAQGIRPQTLEELTRKHRASPNRYGDGK